jgi:hypothetical protein
VLSKYTRKFLAVLFVKRIGDGLLKCPPILKEEEVKGGNSLVSIPKEKMIARKHKKKNNFHHQKRGWLVGDRINFNYLSAAKERVIARKKEKCQPTPKERVIGEGFFF